MKTFLMVAAGLLLVAVGAGAIYYFQLTAPVEVSDEPPAAPTLAVAQRPTNAPATAVAVAAGDATPTPAGVAGASSSSATATLAPQATTVAPSVTIYRIDPAQSEARYTVDETFFDARGLVTVVGTTNAVAGDISIDRANPAGSRLGEIVVDISQLRTDERSRDNAIRREWLQSARYPLATLRNATLSGLPASWPEGQPFTFQIAGDMTVRQATKQVTWDAEAQLDGDTLRGVATTQVKMSDFGFDPPSLSGLRVEDEVKVELEFVAKVVGE
jgi:polyisoprenoid-binding protein YceI